MTSHKPAILCPQLRNTLKFLLGNLQGFDPRSQAVDTKQMHYIDQYMLHLLREFSMKASLNVRLQCSYGLGLNQLCIAVGHVTRVCVCAVGN